MFIERKIESKSDWVDSDGVKIYTISADPGKVNKKMFDDRLRVVKASRDIEWPETPAFCIFHKGESFLYLILSWWGNDNELFTSVSVLTDSGWVEDASRFSFCLYDLEIFWNERNIYIETMYSGNPDIERYRKQRRTSV